MDKMIMIVEEIETEIRTVDADAKNMMMNVNTKNLSVNVIVNVIVNVKNMMMNVDAKNMIMMNVNTKNMIMMNVDAKNMMIMMNANTKNMIMMNVNTKNMMMNVDAEEGISKLFHLACVKTTCVDDYFHRFNFIIDTQGSLV